MYEYETEPYAHQKEVFEASWKAPCHALFLEMGTGKSKIAIDSLAALYEAEEANTALIVAPKGVFSNWVQQELPLHLPMQYLLLSARQVGGVTVMPILPMFMQQQGKSLRRLKDILLL